MGVINMWLESLDYDIQIVHSCSRHQSPHSTCSKCVESCSDNAITFENNIPVLNTDKCTECGNCIAACPVQAVQGIFPKREIVQKKLVITNERAPALKELLVYYKRGITELICKQDSLNEDWQEAITEDNQILAKLGEAPFRVNYQNIDSHQQASCTRRELFTFWKKEAQATMKEMAPAKWRFNQDDLDLSTYYPNYQFVDIKIDTSKCTLCKACQMLCGKKCLKITDTHLTITGQQCSGCYLCQDICPEKAINIEEHIMPASQIEHPLYTKECKVCKGNYQTLSDHDEKCVKCKKQEEYFTY